MGYTRGLGANFATVSRERGNERIIQRPKDESEFLAKEKDISSKQLQLLIKRGAYFKVLGAANQNTYRKFV